MCNSETLSLPVKQPGVEHITVYCKPDAPTATFYQAAYSNKGNRIKRSVGNIITNNLKMYK